MDLANEILSNYGEGIGSSEHASNELTLSSLKQKIEDLYLPQAKSKNIDLSISVAQQKHQVTFPKHKLIQIFGNLITNAIKFTPENGSVDVKLDITMRENSTLEAEINDSGVGMSEEMVDNILSDSAKSTAGTKNERGFGFGFQLARHLVDSLDGSLRIESKQNKGTKILLSLPIVP